MNKNKYCLKKLIYNYFGFCRTIWLFATTFLLSASVVAAFDFSDEAMDGTSRGQQDKGENDNMESRLQNFVEKEQNSKDYDMAELKSTDTPFAYQMDVQFAAMQQDSEDGSENKGMPEMKQDSDEGRTDHDLGNIPQDDDNSFITAAVLQQDQKDVDGKFDILFQQVEAGGDGNDENIYSLLQQTEDRENDNKMQQIRDGNDDNENLVFLQQQKDGEDKDYTDAIVSQDNEREGNGSEEENAVAQWNNHWDGPLNVNCPAGYGLSSVVSVFSSHHRDRVFQFGCRRVS